MPARPPAPSTARRLLRPLLYTTAAGTLLSSALYISYRPRTIPGSEPPVVPPPGYGEGGTFQPPSFPHIKSRAEQIAALKRSSASALLATKTPSQSQLAGFFSAFAWGESSSHTNETNQADVSEDDGEEYDLLIIGGGATGTGIALDAATRGLKVALVERDDFSSGTSSKSTKLVHGGVRYLEKAVWDLDYNQYKLVKEALRERKYFLDTAPHLSMWLPIMLPIDRWWKAPYYWAGTKFYDVLAGSENIESSYFLTKSKALDAFPMLKKDNLFGALVYYGTLPSLAFSDLKTPNAVAPGGPSGGRGVDGAHNDSRMNVSLALTAALYGATVVNHMAVTSLTKSPVTGRLTGAIVQDVIHPSTNPPFAVRAKAVINATGPFTDSVRQMDSPSAAAIVAPSSGVHVVLPGYYSPANMGLIDPSTSDGRVIFFLPWQGNTIAGTTDAATPITAQPIAGEHEIEWILSEIRTYLSPDINVRRSDVLAAWSGIRPLVRDPKAKDTQSLVRNHLVDVSDSGLLTCAGGKWTTYRQMAEDTVDAAIGTFDLTPRALPKTAANVSGTEHELIHDDTTLDGSCQTHRVKLIGTHGYSKTLFINLIQHYGLETEVARHLVESYGDRAWAVAALCRETGRRFPKRGERLSKLYPFVDGEVRYAVREEYAQTAVDVLARRTRLAFLNARASEEAMPGVIEIMGEELKWGRGKREIEMRDGREFLKSMGLKTKGDRRNESGQEKENPTIAKDSPANK